MLKMFHIKNKRIPWAKFIDATTMRLGCQRTDST